MTVILALIKRDTKLFFKDKGLFFTSLITPLILLVLFTTFLGKVYRETFLSALPEGLDLPEKLINGFVSGQLVSSLLAVSCVTVAFCSNMLMVQDKAAGTIRDLTIAPVRRSALACGYYFSTLISTLLICCTAMAAGLLYIAWNGWYLSVADVLLMLLDLFLLVLFGTALSSVVNVFLRSQGQISAVGTIVSSGYGFICGAYMPISQFSAGLQNLLSFLPGTYGTALVRNHALGGAFAALESSGVPAEVIGAMKSGVDFSLTFLDHPVSIGTMYAVLAGTDLLLIGCYILINLLSAREK